MSIYEKGINVPKVDFSFITKASPPFKIGVLLIALLLIIFAVLTLFPYAFTKTIVFSFDKNPISSNEQALLHVTITNTTGATARDASVNVRAVDASSFSVGNATQAIEVLDRSRSLAYIINPVGSVSPGEYEFIITADISGRKISESAVLTVSEN